MYMLPGDVWQSMSDNYLPLCPSDSSKKIIKCSVSICDQRNIGVCFSFIIIY